MTFIFDKDLETEKSIEMEYYSEQVRNHKLTANKEYHIESQSDFPDIEDFSSDTPFTTLEVKDGTMTVPVIGTYNKIETFNTSYISSSKFFQISMTLGYTEE